MKWLGLGAAGLAALSFHAARAECPHACSGNGECGPKDACICYDGFVGGDCSQRTCPYATAFVDVPYGDLNHDGTQGPAGYAKVQWNAYKQPEYWPTTAGFTYGAGPRTAAGSLDTAAIAGGGWAAAGDEAHWYAECAGKGACDRTTGLCACYDGFEGAACQRLTCPNDCSGHGLCRTVGDIAATKATKRLVDSVAGVNTYSGPQDYFVYRLWDATKHRACACDPGYGGFDCSLRECLRGDDPLTNTPSTCGGAPCADEVQNALVAPNQGGATLPDGSPNTDGEVRYRFRFFDFNGVPFDTPEFAVKTKGVNYGAAADAAKRAGVEAGIKAALEGLPNNITGRVAVAVTGDATAAPAQNLRIAVTFTSLSGNVPDMNLLQGATASTRGSPAVAQPFQRVQTVTMTGLTTATTIGATVFPLNLTTVRKDSALTAVAINGAVVDDTTSPAGALAALPGTSAAQVQAAILAAVRSIPTVAYYGGNTVSARTDVVGGAWITTLVLPNADFGTNPVAWALTGAGAVSAQATWSVDGNKEHSVCSNRGVCDATTGLCSCFAGYYGAACDVQSALAN